MNAIKAMILAAGFGTRLLPLTKDTPKPMLQVAGKPLLEHQILQFKKHDVKDIVINLHHFPEKIKDYFGDGSRFDVCVNYSHEPKLLGTAGGVKKSGMFFDSAFIVLYGDNYSNIDLQEFYHHHKSSGAMATILVRELNEKTKASSMIELDSAGFIKKFKERPSFEEIRNSKNTFSNCGIYILEPEVLKHIPNNTFYDFGKDLFPKLLEQSVSLKAFVNKGIWLELGTIEKYYQGKKIIESLLKQETF